MIRLPQRSLPPWAEMLERAHREFESLGSLSSEVVGELAGWLLVEQVVSDLFLDGICVEREKVVAAVLEKAEISSEHVIVARRFARAVEELSRRLSSDGNPATVELTTDLLLTLHRFAVGEAEPSAGQFRQTEVNPLYPGHVPCLPDELPRLVELALEWFAAESVRELHPVEQAALVHTRLADLQPFAKGTSRVIRLAASLYTLRVGLPPIIIPRDLVQDYYQATLSALQMATDPLVELFARALTVTLRQMTEIVRSRQA
ncbi:MAG TPA: Fic family protein [Blastocatellia bacterium]|nr:Fic family protein [Blastocatellia bacterium]